MSTANAEPRVETLGVSAIDAPATPFYIPAAESLQERRPRTLKHGDTFGVFDHNGDARVGSGMPEGLFHRDTRHLSHLSLSINGARPMLLSSTLRDDNATLTCDLTNPDIFDAGNRLTLAHDLVHIRRSRFLWKESCFERLTVRNFSDEPQDITIAIAFAADFSDLFEVRGTQRVRKGELHAPEVGKGDVVLSYTGLDKRQCTTRLSFDPAPTRLDGRSATYRLALGPHEGQSLFIAINCNHQPSDILVRRAFYIALRDARRALRSSSSRAAAIVTSNDIFNEVVRRSISDIYMLITDTPEGPYPYAGIPWFSAAFGRDAIITALEMLWVDPAIARGVLGHLAANQAEVLDPSADAEPGKILHEVRYGEMAELGEVPFRRYYGSVDSTPLFVMLAGKYLGRTGDLASIRELWPSIEAALAWIDAYGDRDGDGFVEYGRRTGEGLINQGWKDSHDSIFHADGSLAHGPIALAEVQAYVYGAWQAAADILRQLGEPGRAVAFEARAEVLRRAFDVQFFDDELGTYVLALDGDKRQCRVRSSNAGHALFAGLAYQERAASIVESLMGASSFSGWGVRTIPSTEARYNPMSYHNGSVWPHDNALIAMGMAQYGYRREAARIFEGVFAASTYIDLRRLPELICGFPRKRAQGPTFYPVACAPQAWAAAAPLALIQACVGLEFHPDEQQISFDEPLLPPSLNEVVFNRLTAGKGSASVSLRRSGQQTVVDVLERQGDMRVMIKV
ncbi:amylo-alpha-1,6-glucosidase [Phyllobacterium endophyticum]|uniref:Amylo-alpha-1,6-glucosidase n=1 Tax=Phyllobacterium endophyticum TaxID=1149773 RepID=A0A2P7AVI6_9HYPH|nr:amylo-alpha-1,6-glucosidase [Phyllobacterium endophyticum]MBB3234792.1 glycogen debranching enzyme [Phyllobacterium endophyticum]PSH58230.1 amylo-alpha-1,6-glucosidase [Phyllobacterium endophyticum]TXR50727.1 amylo-alpha-1,6-glucosidase [Phyllobacterium endophyticum]TYR38910.1 amylo-alpha-1,6-glucosidase [Phyllobacterium endophyticum]